MNFRERFRAIRFREAKAKELLIGETDDIIEFDLSAIKEAAAAADFALCVTLYPGEISAEDAKLIAAIAKEHIDTRLGAGNGSESELAVSMLSGGRSGAMLVQVTPASGMHPFVVKIGADRELRKEMERFKRFIAIDHPQFDPQLFFHRGARQDSFHLGRESR